MERCGKYYCTKYIYHKCFGDKIYYSIKKFYAWKIQNIIRWNIIRNNSLKIILSMILPDTQIFDIQPYNSVGIYSIKKINLH